MALCEICIAIPLERLFGSERGPRRYEIGELKRVRANRSECRLCAFWMEAYDLAYPKSAGGKFKDSRNLKLQLQICTPSDDDTEETEEPWFERAGIWAWNESVNVGPCMWLRFCSAQSMDSFPQDPLICISCAPAQEDLRKNARLMPRVRDCRETEDCRLNYTKIKDWIKCCSSRHVDDCRQSTSFQRQTLNLRLINVETRRIERVSDQRPYVALTYVWGPLHNGYSLQFWQTCKEEGGMIPLPDVLPRTIEDTLTLVRELGLRHLWVDAFCIDQSDSQDVHEQLTNMHLVFECAFLVVAAMKSKHADAGIHGISKDLVRMKQPRISLPYGDFTATYVTDIWKEQGKSPWEQRAWTLQELLLARRILLLHSEYAIMRCQQNIFSGLLEVNDDYHAADFQQCNSHFWENGFNVDLGKSVWDFGNFDAFLANYTSRKLTKPEDVLDACLGALSQITRNTGVGFIQGLPRADIHSALLWKPHHEEMLSRRAGFPSWAWAGWIGRIEHHYCIDDLDAYDTQGPAERRKYLECGGSLASEEVINHITANLEAYIIDGGEQTSSLRISSQVADVSVVLIRRQGKKLRRLPRQSEQARVAVGDQWGIKNQLGRLLANQVGEVARFEAIDYSFQVGPDVSTEIRQRGCECRLVYLKYFPHLRDTNGSGKDSWLFDQVGCLVVMKNNDNGPERSATRIGAVFLRVQDWLDLSPYDDLVTLV